MARTELDAVKAQLLRAGTVIPAHPLALTAERRLDERRQRALSRYYLAAGAGGLAVGVHTTQFEIREVGLLEPVLRLAADEAASVGATRPLLLVAGVLGDTEQALAEAELAAGLGYDLALLSFRGLDDLSEAALLRHAERVSAVLPVVGFYLQPAVGGRRLSYDLWRDLAELPGLAAIKIAPFDRYATLDVVRAVAHSSRADAIALYTGNDDAILVDLLTPFVVATPAGSKELSIVGGLLGQWAVWTRAAVMLLDEVKRVRAGAPLTRELLTRAARLTDANAAVFDAANGFHGVIAGVHEVLRRQGLLAGTWCLDPAEGLSAGQAEAIERVSREHADLTDDAFVAAHLGEWLAP